MAKVSYKDLKPELMSDELQEIENAAVRTILYDEDSPEMTEEMMKQFKRMNQKRNGSLIRAVPQRSELAL